MTNGRCWMNGRKGPGAPTGNANALRHGLYSAQAIAERLQSAKLVRTVHELMDEGDE